jgi:hypothetical protein
MCDLYPFQRYWEFLFCLLPLSMKTSTLEHRAFDASSDPTRTVQCVAFQALSSAGCH